MIHDDHHAAWCTRPPLSYRPDGQSRQGPKAVIFAVCCGIHPSFVRRWFDLWVRPERTGESDSDAGQSQVTRHAFRSYRGRSNTATVTHIGHGFWLIRSDAQVRRNSRRYWQPPSARARWQHRCRFGRRPKSLPPVNPTHRPCPVDRGRAGRWVCRDRRSTPSSRAVHAVAATGDPARPVLRPER